MRAPDFWAAKPGAALYKFLAAALSPLGGMYGAVTTARANRKPLWQAPVPVICVGNAVMGGAGKTQVCLDLARRLSGGSRAVHVLSRGYGGREKGPVRIDPTIHDASDVGDEALVLARHATTWVGAERTRTARAATDAGAGLLIMDDGFQNPDLKKDLNLLVIDGGYGFGNGRVCPAGPLRERAESAFARTDAVCIIGTPGPAMPDIPEDLPVFQARIRPDPGMASLKGKKVIAFAGIGRPEKFFDTLREAGAEIADTVSYPDHHPYSARDLDNLKDRAATLGADLVTTEKDHARLSDAYTSRILAVPVLLEWDDAPALETFLLERIGLN